MQYVIKLKNSNRYYSRAKSIKADWDHNELTSIQYAQIYATRSGAATALRRHCSYRVSRLINKEKFASFEIVQLPN